MFPLGLVLTGQFMLLVLFGLLAAVLGAILLVKLLFKKDDEQEVRLRGYGEVAAWCKEAKLPHLGELFSCLNVLDVSGAVKELLYLIRMIHDPRLRTTLLDPNFEWQLAQKVQDDNWWPRIVQAVQDRQAAIKAAAGRNLQAMRAVVEAAPEPAVQPAAVPAPVPAPVTTTSKR